MSESSTKSRAVKRIRESGRWARRMPSGHLTGGGMPDVMVLLQGSRRGHVMFLEFKEPGKKPEPLQVATIALLRRYGAVAVVVETVDEAMAAVEAAEANAAAEDAALRWRSSAVCDAYTCAYCLSQSGHRDAEPPPHVDCTSPLGCRCIKVAYR